MWLLPYDHPDRVKYPDLPELPREVYEEMRLHLTRENLQSVARVLDRPLRGHILGRLIRATYAYYAYRLDQEIRLRRGRGRKRDRARRVFVAACAGIYELTLERDLRYHTDPVTHEARGHGVEFLRACFQLINISIEGQTIRKYLKEWVRQAEDIRPVGPGEWPF